MSDGKQGILSMHRDCCSQQSSSTLCTKKLETDTQMQSNTDAVKKRESALPNKSPLDAPKMLLAVCSVSSRVFLPELSSLMACRKTLKLSFDSRCLHQSHRGECRQAKEAMCTAMCRGAVAHQISNVFYMHNFHAYCEQILLMTISFCFLVLPVLQAADAM